MMSLSWCQTRRDYADFIRQKLTAGRPGWIGLRPQAGNGRSRASVSPDPAPVRKSCCLSGAHGVFSPVLAETSTASGKIAGLPPLQR